MYVLSAGAPLSPAQAHAQDAAEVAAEAVQALRAMRGE